MDFTLALIFVSVFSVCIPHQIKIVNNCSFPIWPGILGNPQKESLAKGGFFLDIKTETIIDFPNDWAGRIWARTACDAATGHCETGDCGNVIECSGAGGTPPVTLVEMTFMGADGKDFYDISLVDGYNLPVKMLPTGGFVRDDAAPYYCKPAGCASDLNPICPEELKVLSGSGAFAVACKSACMQFGTSDYCCKDEHGTPDTCKSTDWKVNYPAIFKQACPDAYSYAYDDSTSTFTCLPDAAVTTGMSYDVVFCP